jgi:hypothetical protein
MQIRKKGDEIKKISSPLKLMSQFQPSFAEMILGWSLFNILLTDALLKGDHPRIISAKFGEIGSVVSERIFLNLYPPFF